MNTDDLVIRQRFTEHCDTDGQAWCLTYTYWASGWIECKAQRINEYHKTLPGRPRLIASGWAL